MLKRLLKRFKRKNLGFDVTFKLERDFIRRHQLSDRPITYHNVTEIHYNYRQALSGDLRGRSVAFESDIHGTGIVWDECRILEFEAKLATKIHKSF